MKKFSHKKVVKVVSNADKYIIKIIRKSFPIKHPKNLTWHHSGAFISDFEHILHIASLFLLFWKDICLMGGYHLLRMA